MGVVSIHRRCRRVQYGGSLHINLLKADTKHVFTKYGFLQVTAVLMVGIIEGKLTTSPPSISSATLHRQSRAPGRR